MLWEIEIRPLGDDADRRRVAEEFDLLTHSGRGASLVTAASRGYLLETDRPRADVERLARDLLVDPLVETGRVDPLNEHPAADLLATVLLQPGVMDPTALSVVDAARDLGLAVDSVRTFRRYFGPTPTTAEKDVLFRKVLANEAIEQVVAGPLALEHLALGRPYRFRLVTVPLRDLGDAALLQLSRDGQLALSLDEMRTIQTHFHEQSRDPADVELETLAQTWTAE